MTIFGDFELLDFIDLDEMMWGVTGPRTQSISDTLSLNDVISKNISRPNSDSLSLTDGLSQFLFTALSVSDSISLLDSKSNQFLPAINDTIALSDVSANAVNTHRTDVLSITDSYTAAIPHVFTQSASDSISQADSISKSPVKSRGDTLSFTDAQVKRYLASKADGISFGVSDSSFTIDRSCSLYLSLDFGNSGNLAYYMVRRWTGTQWVYYDWDTGTWTAPDPSASYPQQGTGSNITYVTGKFTDGWRVTSYEPGLTPPTNQSYWNFTEPTVGPSTGAMLGGTYTIDFWMQADSSTTLQPIINWLLYNNTGWQILYGSMGLYIRHLTGGIIDSSETATCPCNLSGSYHHVEISSDGATLRFFVDGVLTTSCAALPVDSNFGSLSFGCINGDLRSVDYKIDEIRFSRGIVRHTANFTPPTTAYQSAIAASSDLLTSTLSRNIPDTLSSDDAISKNFGRSRSDSLSFTDAFSQIKFVVYPLSLSDMLSMTDGFTFGGGNAFVWSIDDSIAQTDSFAQAVSKVFLDTQGMSDGLQRYFSKKVDGDTIYGEDAFVKALRPLLSDVITPTDSKFWLLSRALTDTLVPVDGFAKNMRRGFPDLISISDSFKKQPYANMTDIISVLDSNRFGISKSNPDIMNLVDTFANTMKISKADAAFLTDMKTMDYLLACSRYVFANGIWYGAAETVILISGVWRVVARINRIINGVWE